MSKVNKEVVRRLISEAREALEEVREISTMDLNEFVRSRRARFSLRYSVVLSLESLTDLAVAILEKDFDVMAESYREAFLKLAEKGIVNAELAESMARLAGLRNMIVHRYWTIDDTRIYHSARGSGVRAVEDFVEEVRRYVEAEDP